MSLPKKPHGLTSLTTFAVLSKQRRLANLGSIAPLLIGKETRMARKISLWTFPAMLLACAGIRGALSPARSTALISDSTFTV
jgi:hypothetical protein